VLIDFTFKNIRSFKEEVTFSMEVGEGVIDYTRENTISSGDTKVVKSSFIFGGNTSGKSNVIRAFQLLRDIIVYGTSSELEALPVDSFANGEGNTYFKIQFIKNGNLYCYKLDYDAHSINEERLIMNDNIIFNRTVDDIIMPSSIKGLKGALRANQPLLFFAQSNNVPEAKESYEWFAQDILILGLGHNVLIATTHNTDILDAPIRTDQVWFVDKSYYGISTLDNAFDYNELSIKGIKKSYQDGLYGAIQIINDSMIKDILF
jgi:hypothetical protein